MLQVAESGGNFRCRLRPRPVITLRATLECACMDYGRNIERTVWNCVQKWLSRCVHAELTLRLRSIRCKVSVTRKPGTALPAVGSERFARVSLDYAQSRSDSWQIDF